MNIDWSNRRSVINLAQGIANRGQSQIVYKIRQRTNYNICHADNWLKRLEEMRRQDMEVTFVLTVEKACNAL